MDVTPVNLERCVVLSLFARGIRVARFKISRGPASHMIETGTVDDGEYEQQLLTPNLTASEGDSEGGALYVPHSRAA